MAELEQQTEPVTKKRTVADLGRAMKKKFPKVYDDVDDEDLGRAAKKKYPGAYDDFEDPSFQTAPPASQATGQLPPADAGGTLALPSSGGGSASMLTTTDAFGDRIAAGSVTPLPEVAQSDATGAAVPDATPEQMQEVAQFMDKTRKPVFTQPDNAAYGLRDRKIRREFEEAGRPGSQYTRAREAAKRKADTWTEQDEVHKRVDALLFQRDLLRARANEVDRLRMEAVDELGDPLYVSEIEDEAMEVQAGFDYLKESYEKLPTSDKELAVRQRIANKDFEEGNALNQGVMNPLSQTATAMLLNTAGSAARMVDAFINIPQTITDQEPYYSPFAQVADEITGVVEKVEAMSPTVVKSPLFGTPGLDGKIHGWRFNKEGALPKAVAGLTYMVGLGTAGAAGGIKGMTAASFLTTEEDYYREAIEAGLKPEQAQGFSIRAALTTSLLESVNPGPLLGQSSKQMLKKALKDVAGRKLTTKEALKEWTAYTTKEALGEGGQELTQGWGDLANKAATNIVIGEPDGKGGIEKKLSVETSMQEMAEQFALGAALGGLVGGASALRRKPLTREAIEWAVQNPDQMTEAIGALPPEQQAQATERFKAYQKAYDGMPKAMDGEDKAEARQEMADALVEKQVIAQERKEETPADDQLKALVEEQTKMKYEAREEEANERIRKAAVAAGLVTKEQADATVEEKEPASTLTSDDAIRTMSSALSDKNAGLRVEEGEATGVTYAEVKGGPAAGLRQPVLVTNKAQVEERLKEVAGRMKGRPAKEVRTAQGEWVTAATEEEQHHIDQQSDGTMDNAEEKWSALPKKVRQAVELLYDRNAFDENGPKKSPTELWAEYDRMRRQVEAGGAMTEEALYGKTDPIAARVREHFESEKKKNEPASERSKSEPTVPASGRVSGSDATSDAGATEPAAEGVRPDDVEPTVVRPAVPGLEPTAEAEPPADQGEAPSVPGAEAEPVPVRPAEPEVADEPSRTAANGVELTEDEYDDALNSGRSADEVIPTRSLFLQPIRPQNKLKETDSPKLVEAGKFTDKEVAFWQIHPSQRFVDLDYETTPSDKIPLVYETEDGSFVVVDGHHRILRDSKGDKDAKVKVRVLDVGAVPDDRTDVIIPPTYKVAMDEYKRTDLGSGERGRAAKQKLADEAATDEGKAFVAQQVDGIKKNEDGTITVYRSGTLQDGHNPATTDKKTAELIAKERAEQGLSSDITTINVLPGDISVVVPGVENEVFVNVTGENKARLGNAASAPQYTAEEIQEKKAALGRELVVAEKNLNKFLKDRESGALPQHLNTKNNEEALAARVENLKWQISKLSPVSTTADTPKAKPEPEKTIHPGHHRVEGQPKTMLGKAEQYEKLLASEAVSRLKEGEYGNYTGIGIGPIVTGGAYLEMRKTDKGFGAFDRDSKKKTPVAKFNTIEEALQWATDRVYERKRSEGYVEEGAEKTEAQDEVVKVRAGDRVTFLKNNKELSGTVRDVDTDRVSIDTDQITTAGGVPIGRIELVPHNQILHVEPREEDEAPEAAEPSAEAKQPFKVGDRVNFFESRSGSGLSRISGEVVSVQPIADNGGFKYSVTTPNGGNVDRTHAELQADETPKPTKQPFSNLSDEKRKRALELQERLRKKLGGQLSSGIDPELMAIGVEYSALMIENGARGFAAYANSMVEALGDQIKPYLKSLYSAARYAPGVDVEGMSPDSEVSGADLELIITPTNGTDQGSDVSPSDERRDAPELDDREAPSASGEDVPGGDAGAIPGADVPGVPGPGSKPAKGGKRNDGAGGRKRGSKDGADAGERGDGTAAATEPGASQQDQAADASKLNHVLPADRDWFPSGEKARVRANIAAIKLLKELEAENRNATPEEKDVLAKYVGWGGLKNALDVGSAALRDKNSWYMSEADKTRMQNWEKDWRAVYDEIKAALTPTEWYSAIQSTQYAFYTSREVVTAVWSALRRLGFRGGSALEPSAGIGNFMGLGPRNIDWHAIDNDDISGRILTKLYPEARVDVKGFEEVRIALNSLDLGITNAPFAQAGVNDPDYPGMNLHNYFIVRLLDLAKPGALVAVITSSRTLDSPGSISARRMMDERADMVGAIRLPNNAFKKNSGTDVTTDILFFRKKDNSQFQGADFVSLGQATTHDGRSTFLDKNQVEQPFRVNEYFLNNPSMVLGKLSMEGTMYGEDGEMAVLPNPGKPLDEQLAEAIAQLPANVAGNVASTRTARPKVAAAGSKVGSLLLEEDGKPVVVTSDGVLKAPEWASDEAKVGQAKRYVGIREQLKQLLEDERDTLISDEQLEASRTELNAAYDAYVKAFGNVQDMRKNRFLAESDTEFPAVAALEHAIPGEKKGNRRTFTYVKSEVLQRAVNRPVERPDFADTAEDAVDISVNWTGEVDMDYIASMLRRPRVEAEAMVRDTKIAFENPSTGLWETPERYLTGFVKQKLNAAKKAAELDSKYEANVEELEKVQPAPIRLEKIDTSIGARWIPTKAYVRFAREAFGMDLDIQYMPALGRYSMTWSGNETSHKNEQRWGVSFSPDVANSVALTGHKLFDLAMDLKQPFVVLRRKNEPDVKDEKATEVARAKVEEMNEAFKKFIQENQELAQEVENVYNESKNIAVRPRFRLPSFKHFPGAVKEMMKDGKFVPMVLRDHQKRAVSRMLSGCTMLAHSVGTGKTYAMITASMEMRRLGLAKKPVHAVQNATVEQYAASFRDLYPGAKVLTPPPGDLNKLARNIFMSQIAMNDWDAVIVPHSFMERLPNDPKREQAYIEDAIAELIEAKTSSDNRSVTKAIGKAIEKLEKKLKETQAREKDNVLSFEQLGVDAMFLDEAHEFKKLMFLSQRDNIKGLDKGFSAKGENMYLKVRWIQENNRGRNVIFATGTPVSNTLAELWNFVRVLAPQVAENFKVSKFDEFDTAFADVVSNYEITAAGAIKKVSRFAKFKNLQALLNMWLSVADVVTADEAEIKRPPIKGGKPTAVSIESTYALDQYTKHLMKAYNEYKAMKGETKKANNHIPLRINALAKMASLDIRMVSPDMDDNPEMKLNVVANKVKEIYDATNAFKGVQMVFSDSINEDGAAKKVTGKTFNAYKAIKRRLVALGVPAEEVLIVTDLKKGKQREEAFAGLKTGKYRVAIGGTKTLGTGVNAQDLLAALHHLDAPYRPMDMEQREGRIIRQGNRVFDDYGWEPEVLRYGVEGTLDATLFGILAVKQKFIQQVLGGHVNDDEIDDVGGGVDLNYEEMSAAISGDMRLLDKARLSAELRSLSAQRDAHFQTIRDSALAVTQLEALIPKMEENLKRDTALAERYGKLFEDLATATLRIGGKEYKGKEVALAPLETFLKAGMDRTIEVAASEYRGVTIEKPIGVIEVNGEQIAFKAMIPVSKGLFSIENAHFEWEFVEHQKFHGTNSGAPGFYQSFAKTITTQVQEEPARIQRAMDIKKRDLHQAKSMAGGTFDKADEIAQKQKKLDALDESLKKDSEAKAGEPEGSAIPFVSVFIKAKDFQRQDAFDEDEDGGGDDEPGPNGPPPPSGVNESRVSFAPAPKGAYNMSESDLRSFLDAMFGKAGLGSGTASRRGGTWVFKNYEAFHDWMMARYAERDLEGMRMAYVEQHRNSQVRFVRETRRAPDHLKEWMNHIVTGSPLPDLDQPVARTTPRPGPNGKVVEPPTAPPPPPPKRQPTARVPFDTTALVQFLGEFKKFPIVNRRLRRVLGRYLGKDASIELIDRLFLDPEDAKRTLAHEIGHFIDLGIELEGKGVSFARKLKPLRAMEKRIKDSAELKRQARALSAEWRGPFQPDDPYRSSSNELFADFMSAIMIDPEMVNQEYPLLHDVFQELLDGKPEFSAAYKEITDRLSGNTVVREARRRMDEASDQSKAELLKEADRPSRNYLGRTRDWLAGLFLSPFHRTKDIEKKEISRDLGRTYMDVLENSPLFAARENMKFEDTFRRVVAPIMERIDPDSDTASKILNQYIQANRTINERRGGGVWIEQHPDEARKLLAKITENAMLSKWSAEVAAAKPAELYDLAARIIRDVHLIDKQRAGFADKIELVIDKMQEAEDWDIPGQSALLAFDVRGKLLNPEGLTVETAAKLIQELQQELGPSRFAAVEQAQRALSGMLFDIQRNAAEEGLISEKTYREVVLPNQDNYAPYAVLDYWDAHVGAGMRAQRGTAKSIANTVWATQLKAAALNNWRQRQYQAHTLVSMYQNAGFNDLVETPLKKHGEGIDDIRKKHLHDDISRIVIYRNGVQHMVELPGDPGKSFEHALTSPTNWEALDLLGPVGDFIGTTMQLYTTMSLPFVFWNNPVRDTRTTAGRTGFIASAKALFSGGLKEYPKLAMARNYARAAYGGQLSPEVLAMIESGVLPPPRAASAMIRDKKQRELLITGGMMMAYNLKDGQGKWGLFNSIKKKTGLEWMRRTLAAYEALSKIYALEAAKNRGDLSPKAQAGMAMRAGIPKPNVSGNSRVVSAIMELLYTWTRVHIQGLRASMDILRQPQTGKGMAARLIATELLPRFVSSGIPLAILAWALADDDDDEEAKKTGAIATMAEAFRRASPYKLGLGNMMPMMFYDPREGKYHYMWEFWDRPVTEIPAHYEIVSWRVPSSEEGRFVGPLAYNTMVSQNKEMRAGGMDVPKTIGSWIENQVLVGNNPLFEAGSNVGAMLTGENPDNEFTGLPAANPLLFDAGWGDGRGEAVTGYALTSLGYPGQLAGILAANIGMLDQKALNQFSRRLDSDKVPFPERIPGLTSMLSYDNYVPVRTYKEERIEDERARAQAKLLMPREVKEMYDFYNRHRGRKDQMDEFETARLEFAKGFVNDVWGDAMLEGDTLNVPIVEGTDTIKEPTMYGKALWAATNEVSPMLKDSLQQELLEKAEPYLTGFKDPKEAVRMNRILDKAINEAIETKLKKLESTE